MRKTSLSQQEVAELDETKAKEARKSGLNLIPERDRGYHRLRNGVMVYWNHPTREHQPSSHNGIEIVTKTTPRVAPGEFGIEVDGRIIRFDADELRMYLRWS